MNQKRSDEGDASLAPSGEPLWTDMPSAELPGMLERADFTGGETDNPLPSETSREWTDADIATHPLFRPCDSCGGTYGYHFEDCTAAASGVSG